MTISSTTTPSAGFTRRHHARSLCAVSLTGLIALTGCDSQPHAPDAGEPSPTQSASTSPAADPDVLTLSDEAMRTGGITVEPPRAESRADYFETPAVLQLDETRTARIGSIVEGVVAEANVQVGAHVSRGARLASIHSHMVHEAWAEYRRALAERRRATTQLAFMKDAEGRAFRLLAAKAASQQEADRARTDRAAAEEALVIAESEVRRALDELEHIGITAEPAVVNDPRDTVPVTTVFGGVVLERLVTTGTAVTVGTPLFVVSDLSRLWAVAEIDEGRLPALAVGRSAVLEVAAYPQRPFPSRVVAIGDSVNRDTRRVTARIEVENRDGALKPQMYATVRLPTGDERQVVIVPAAAVQKIDQQPVVFVETGPARFTRRTVVPGPERDGFVEIREGLRANERVATSGTFLIKSKFVEGARPE